MLRSTSSAPPVPPALGHARQSVLAATRAGVLGALTGLFVGSAGQAVVARFAAEATASTLPTWWERAVGVAVTASLLGAVVFLSTAVALLPARRLGVRSRRRLAVGLATALGTVVLLLHVLGVAVHVLMGSHLTSSGLAFFLNSSEHIVGAIRAQYLGYLLPTVALALVLSAALAWILRRGMTVDPGRVRRAEVGGCAAMVAVAGFATVAPAREPIGPRIARTSPEVALLASVASAGRAHDPLVVDASPLVRQALDSPSLEERASWLEVAREVGDRPNVIVVTLESVATSHLGYLGYARNVTPNLDRIAAQSLRMTHAYTTATHSNYAQMAVISSLFPRRSSSFDMYHRLDYPRVLLHDLGSSIGYATATISSQDETWQGMKRFQETGTATYFRHAPDHQGEHLDLVTEDVSPDEETIHHAIGWIDRNKDTPFSVYINLQSTHFPYPIPSTAPRPFLPDEPRGTFNYVVWERSDLPAILNRYDNALHYVDIQLGRLYDALEAKGLLDHTVLVITADHGELFFEHDLVTHGRTLFEGESRVPFLVHYPAVLAPGDDATPVSSLDVLPTVVDAMRLPPHPAHQGESVAHLREDGPAGKRTAVFLNIQGWKHYEGVVCYPYKLVADPDTGGSELYDLARDPGELRDLAAQKPAIVAALRETLRAQMDAQDVYHANDEVGKRLKRERFAPRLLPCPALDR